MTNARHAGLIAVVARIGADRGSAARAAVVLLSPKVAGLRIGEDLPRLGVRGVSLASVELCDCPVDPDANVVGGLACDVSHAIASAEISAALNFAARSVGLALGVVEECRRFISTARGGQEPLAHLPVVRSRFAAVVAQQRAAESLLNETLRTLDRDRDPLSSAQLTKVFCSDAAQSILHTAMHLHGGAGYAGASPLHRHYRDGASLVLVDTPNEVLLDKVGQRLLY